MPKPLRLRRKLLPVLAAPAALVLAIVGVPSVNEHRASAGPILTEPAKRFPNWEAPGAFQGPVARAECGPGSRPETGMQGEVSVADRESGRSSLGYSCNMDEVGLYGPDDPSGFEGAEWQLARYQDCAYYSQRLFPEPRSVKPLQERQGTIIVDVSNPEDPKFVKNLFTPGMMDPWETLKVNQARGLLAAVNVKDGEGFGFFEIYDVKDDCKNPKLLSNKPISVVNHEGNFSRDGNTYYSGGLQPGIISAIDVSDPTDPHLLTTFFAKFGIHGMSTNEDGTRLFVSHINEDWPLTLDTVGHGNGDMQTIAGGNGMGIYDISQIQNRKPNPQVSLISAVEWTDGQIGQHTLHIFKNGNPYAIEVDEAGHGAARIIDIRDERNPVVVSKLKTEIMMPDNRATATSETERPGKEKGGFFGFGYNFHYCNVDKMVDPSMLACSAFQQGLRVFDIRNFSAPRELAYFNPGGDGTEQPGSFGGVYSGYTAAMPQFVPDRHEIWFTDQDRGLYVTRLTNGAWISQATEADVSHGN